jgi:Bacterial TniB protein
VLGGRGDTRREFLNLLRFLGNELRIPLVGVGARDAYLAIRSDGQLENRFAPLALPPVIFGGKWPRIFGTVWQVRWGRCRVC